MKKFSALLYAVVLITIALFASAALADTYVYTNENAEVGILQVSGDTLTPGKASTSSAVFKANLGNQLKVFGNSQDFSVAYLGGKNEIVEVKASGDEVVTTGAASLKPNIGEVKTFVKSGDYTVATGANGLYVSPDLAAGIAAFTSSDTTGFKAAAPMSSTTSQFATDLAALNTAIGSLAAGWPTLGGDVRAFLTALNGSEAWEAGKGVNVVFALNALLKKTGDITSATGNALTLNPKGALSFATRAGDTKATTVTFSGAFTGLTTLGSNFYLASANGVSSGVSTLAMIKGFEEAAKVQQALLDLQNLLAPLTTKMQALLDVLAITAIDAGDVLSDAGATAFAEGTKETSLTNLVALAGYAAILNKATNPAAFSPTADAGATSLGASLAGLKTLSAILVNPTTSYITTNVTDAATYLADVVATATNLAKPLILAEDGSNLNDDKAGALAIAALADGDLDLTVEVLSAMKSAAKAWATLVGVVNPKALINAKATAAWTTFESATTVASAAAVLKDIDDAATDAATTPTTATVAMKNAVASPVHLVNKDNLATNQKALAAFTAGAEVTDTAKFADALKAFHEAAADDGAGLSGVAGALEDLAKDLKAEAFASGNVEAIAADEANSKIYMYADKKVYVQALTDTKSTDITGDTALSFTTTTKSLDMVASGKYLSIIDDEGLSVFDVSGTTMKQIGEKQAGIVSVARLTATLGGDNPDPKPEPTPTVSPVVDFSGLDADVQTNIRSSVGAEEASYFLTSADVSTDTLPASASEKVTAAINASSAMGGKDAKTITPVTTFKALKDGFIVLDTPKYDPAKYAVFFIDESLLAAAANGVNEAVLMDDKGNPCEDGETSAYIGAGELTAGQTYTLYAAEKDSGGNNTGSGSSSGGCNAGFAGIAALAALALIKKSK